MKTQQTKSLKELSEIWMAMERKTLEQRKKADKYYEEYLMQPIVDDYKERNSDLVFEQVDYLILSVGTSYEPQILNISLLHPRRILFLYTAETEKVLDKIVRYLELEVTDYEKNQVEATDSLSIYHEIKKVYLSWDRPAKVYIDFTGGTKTMSAAAALAGSLIGVQLIYVGTQSYLTDFRKPEPGSEELFYIDNPIEVFGDLELEKVFALIERYNYAGAAEKLKNLKENIPDPLNRQQISFVYLLVKIYEHWDALEFEAATELMEQLLQELKRDYRMYKKILMMDFQPILRNQYKVLRQLKKIPELIKLKNQEKILGNKAIIVSLMYTIYENAKRREDQEKYDMATLLWYRLLEMIEQRRLMTYQINVSKPEYQKADFSKASKEYEDKISDGKAMNQLRRIRSMVSLRNNSIFAHGLGPVKESDYYKFRDFVSEMFQDFCSTEEIDFKAYGKACHFLNPINSKYYSIMGDE